MMFELQFSSLHELFWMNGHGPYVWGSYALALVALIFLVWSPLARRRQLLHEIRRTLNRDHQLNDKRRRAEEHGNQRPGTAPHRVDS